MSDAGQFIAKLRKREHAWRAAIKALMMVAEYAAPSDGGEDRHGEGVVPDTSAADASTTAHKSQELSVDFLRSELDPNF